MPEETVITVENLTKIYNQHTAEAVTALEDIDLEISDNEFVSIVGPSGCGKSTLLKIVAGLIETTSGSVRVMGTDVTGPTQETGLVFQDPSLFPWRTVMRNASFGLEVMGADKEQRQRKAQEMLDLVGLGGFENAYPEELSGGMKQRVNLARTLATDPEILLMDEPFGALDEQTRMFMGQELLRIWKETNQTIVFVTHSLQESVLLSDRVAVMSNRPGKILHTVDVDLPRPRETDIIENKRFTEIQSEIWSIIEDESSRTLGVHSEQSQP
jgi:NitT/TauT family transport system ATP-binding protein